MWFLNLFNKVKNLNRFHKFIFQGFVLWFFLAAYGFFRGTPLPETELKIIVNLGIVVLFYMIYQMLKKNKNPPF